LKKGKRWSARADASHVIRKHYVKIRECLNDIAENEMENHLTRHEASCLSKQMDTLEVALMTVIWDTILKRFDATNCSLQSINISLGQSVQLYDSLGGFLQSVRNEFDRLEEEAQNLVDGAGYQQNRKKTRKPAFDESREEDAPLLPRDAFRTRVFYTIIDHLIVELHGREEKYKLLCTRFDFLHNWRQMSDSELYDAASSFRIIYAQDIEDFGDELIQMKHLLKNENMAVDPNTLLVRLLSVQVRSMLFNSIIIFMQSLFLSSLFCSLFRIHSQILLLHFEYI
jgi:hypothetical protein